MACVYKLKLRKLCVKRPMLLYFQIFARVWRRYIAGAQNSIMYGQREKRGKKMKDCRRIRKRVSRASRDTTRRGYVEKRTRAGEKKKRKRRGAGGQKESENHGLLYEKNQVPRAYVFPEGGSPVTRSPELSVRWKEGGGVREKEETERTREGGREKGSSAAVRERLPNAERPSLALTKENRYA